MPGLVCDLGHVSELGCYFNVSALDLLSGMMSAQFHCSWGGVGFE